MKILNRLTYETIFESCHDKAQIHYRQYRALLKKSQEDIEIMRGYRQLAKGTPLISLPDAIFAGGFDEKLRPKLAVCHAHLRVCRLARQGRTFTFTNAQRRDWRELVRETTKITCPECEALGELNAHGYRPALTVNAQAIVPNIPAHLRPASALHNYHILWEAE